MSIRVALFLALFCAPAGAAPVTESWSSELDLIIVDNPPSLFTGFPLGTPVSGSLDYDDACPSAECEVRPDESVAIYTFPNGTADLSFGTADLAHSPAAPVHVMRIVISNDAPLVVTTANVLSELLNITIEHGTPVDSWVLTSHQEDESGNRTQFGISYTSLDTTLYDDTRFRGPPDLSEVVGVTFGVGEGLFGSTYFGSGLIDVPEPGAPVLLTLGALVLGLARRVGFAL